MRSELSQTVHPWTGANPFQQVRARYPRRLNDPWSILASRGPAGEGLRDALNRLRALPRCTNGGWAWQGSLEAQDEARAIRPCFDASYRVEKLSAPCPHPFVSAPVLR
jgi:hypothetical protein